MVSDRSFTTSGIFEAALVPILVSKKTPVFRAIINDFIFFSIIGCYYLRVPKFNIVKVVYE